MESKIKSEAAAMANVICEMIMSPMSGVDGEMNDLLLELLASALESLGEQRLHDAADALFNLDCTYLVEDAFGPQT